ncbi:ZrgA family zinc uptake protein, partial [Vibrio fluvialis]
MLRKTSLAILVGLSFSALASAQEGFRQHDAHVHGQVEFNIAQDGHDLLLEITAPGADVVGFEHAPENTEQENQLKAAVEKLSQADLMVQINEAAKCTIENVS